MTKNKNTQDKRYQLIHQWVKDCFNQSEIVLKPLTGDASFRHYYRLTLDKQHFIVMDAPPNKEPLDDFLKTTNYLLSLGLNVPRIYHENQKIGSLVLSDFGDKSVAYSLRNEDPKLLYQKAIDALLILESDKHFEQFPAFDKNHIQTELSLFDEWFLKKHLHYANTIHRDCYSFLTNEILQQPTVAIHRDYHSRNLMLCDDKTIGIIDHQDLMQGPLTYDLVSLLRDCYVDFNDDFVNEMICYYQERSTINCVNLRYYFDLTGIQRHLKAIGIFSRLNYRDNNPNYLQYIPNTLQMVAKISEKYPKLKALSSVIREVS